MLFGRKKRKKKEPRVILHVEELTPEMLYRKLKDNDAAIALPASDTRRSKPL